MPVAPRSEDAILSELSAWTQGILRKKRKVDAKTEEEGEEDWRKGTRKLPMSDSAVQSGTAE